MSADEDFKNEDWLDLRMVFVVFVHIFFDKTAKSFKVLHLCKSTACRAFELLHGLLNAGDRKKAQNSALSFGCYSKEWVYVKRRN